MKENRLIGILLAAVLLLGGVAFWLAKDTGMLNDLFAKVGLRADGDRGEKAAVRSDTSTGSESKGSYPGDQVGQDHSNSQDKQPGQTEIDDRKPANRSGGASDSEETDSVSSAGSLKLVRQQAEFMRPGEFIRRWPAGSGLVTDVTGGAPRLQDFEGRPFGPEALKGSVVFLDYGHGGRDGGTAYPINPPHEVVEKDITLEVGRLVKEKLEACGATVVTMRDEDVWFSVYGRMAKTGEYLVEEAKKNLLAADPKADLSYLDSFAPVFERIYQLNMDQGGGDILGGVGMARQTRLLYDLQSQFENAIYVSLHCNFSETDSEAGGTQAFYYTNEDALDFAQLDLGVEETGGEAELVYPVYQNYDGEGRMRLAETMHAELTTTVPLLKNRNAPSVLPGDYAFLRCTGLNSVLLEMGFLSNPDDRALLASTEGQDLVAEGVAKGIYAYFCKAETPGEEPDGTNQQNENHAEEAE